MPMPERQRRQYNKECHAVDALKEKRRSAKSHMERANLTEQLRKAYIAFDEKWNGYTPTEKMLARWLAIN